MKHVKIYSFSLTTVSEKLKWNSYWLSRILPDAKRLSVQFNLLTKQ